jgi:uncharacterized membrane protein YgdD (TMEM256/DUF423 family)
MQGFLVLGAVFGLTGTVLGAFGSHALRSKLPPDRLGSFETGVRYQMWHALALLAVLIVDAWSPSFGSSTYILVDRGAGWPVLTAGWLFVAGIVLFSGSLYALALTGRRTWGAVAPLGGACLVLGWTALLLAAWVK